MISNRDSDPIEISVQELEDMPLEAAFHLYKENEPLPQHSSSGDGVSRSSNRSTDWLPLKVSSEVTDYIGGAAPWIHFYIQTFTKVCYAHVPSSKYNARDGTARSH